VIPRALGVYVLTDVGLVDVVPALKRVLDDMSKEDSAEAPAATPVPGTEWELLPFSFVLPE
jgi:HEAT repeat protein